MVSISQVCDLVRSYVAEQVGLDRFSEQFESLYGDAVAQSHNEVLVYVDCVASFLARVRAGYSSEADLKIWLEPFTCETPEVVSNGYRDVSSTLPYSRELVSAR